MRLSLANDPDIYHVIETIFLGIFSISEGSQYLDHGSLFKSNQLVVKYCTVGKPLYMERKKKDNKFN